MAELVLFNESYGQYIAGNTYLVSDENAIIFTFDGIATIASEPISISNATIQVDMSSTNQAITGGSQTTKLIDVNGNVLLPSGTPSKIIVEITRPSDVSGYTANDSVNTSISTPTLVTFPDSAIANGGGGFLYLMEAESNMLNLAGQTLRFWFYNDTPTEMVGDNVPFINLYVNSAKRCFYVDLTFDVLLGGSDSVFGQVKLSDEYVTKTSGKDMYALIQTLTSWIPTSGGKITISLSVVKLS